MPDDTKQSTDPERREYLKHYQRDLRRRMRRADILFDPSEYERIKRAAVDHNMKLAPFMRACINAYLNQHFIPPDADRVRHLEMAILRVGGNINQIAKRVNTNKVADQPDINAMNRHLAELEDAVSFALREPPDLLQLIAERIQKDPALSKRIQNLIEEQGNDR